MASTSSAPDNYKTFDEWVEHHERKLGIDDEVAGTVTAVAFAAIFHPRFTQPHRFPHQEERETNPFAETYIPGWQQTAERVVDR